MLSDILREEIDGGRNRNKLRSRQRCGLSSIHSRLLYSTQVIERYGFPHLSASLRGHYGCVNCMDFSGSDGRFLVTSSDDSRILIWNLYELPKPRITAELRGHSDAVQCVIFDHAESNIISCGNDGLVLRFNIERQTLCNESAFHFSSVNSVSVAPFNDEVVLTSSWDGRCSILDFRASNRPQSIHMNTDHAPILTSLFHPTNPLLFATGDVTGAARLWDTRTTLTSASTKIQRMGSTSLYEPQQTNNYSIIQPLVRYNLEGAVSSRGFRIRNRVERQRQRRRVDHGSLLMSTLGSYEEYSRDEPSQIMKVQFDSTGEHIAILRRKSSPVIFDVHDGIDATSVFCERGFRNSATANSVAFGGADDRFIGCGSDSNKAYIWNRKLDEKITRKPSAVHKSAYVLDAHRSIVNTIKFHPILPIVATAGIEKVVRLWSSLPLLSSTTSSTLRSSDESSTHRMQRSRTNVDFRCEESPRTISIFNLIVQSQMHAESDSESISDSIAHTNDEDEEEDGNHSATDPRQESSSYD
uniref:Uncharacterized protein n=1 Tax=Timspurckia oligopyrenoides TaxID=708627 RepID=A0A7S0ZK67_9RHOD|mmetsp:Transcript_8479/g.15344  ORF Transcript_8479/g.15344 Transcript_8479/m.15344 type:complete len:527 (+) Transcript_8479:196-1776(+)